MSEWSLETFKQKIQQDDVIVIDNRIFLLGLDVLYRDRMKRFESDRLLNCAHRVVQALSVQPADVPIEGYYTKRQNWKNIFD